MASDHHCNRNRVAAVSRSVLSGISTSPHVGFFLGISILLTCGCHDRKEDFKPNLAIAERALSQALEDWKAGKLVGEIAGTSPRIHVTDTNRDTKRQLMDFKVLGERTSSTGRMFAVELSLNNPVQQIKTEYILVGIDPLWVFRRDDFELLMHWDHRMPALPTESNNP